MGCQLTRALQADPEGCFLTRQNPKRPALGKGCQSQHEKRLACV